jgi:hypothetical protein
VLPLRLPLCSSHSFPFNAGARRAALRIYPIVHTAGSEMICAARRLRHFTKAAALCEDSQLHRSRHSFYSFTYYLILLLLLRIVNRYFMNI